MLGSPGEEAEESPLPGHLDRTPMILLAHPVDSVGDGHSVEDRPCGQGRTGPADSPAAGDLDPVGEGPGVASSQGGGGSVEVGRDPEVRPTDPVPVPGVRGWRLASGEVDGEGRRGAGGGRPPQAPPSDPTA